MYTKELKIFEPKIKVPKILHYHAVISGYSNQVIIQYLYFANSNHMIQH